MHIRNDIFVRNDNYVVAHVRNDILFGMTHFHHLKKNLLNEKKFSLRKFAFKYFYLVGHGPRIPNMCLDLCSDTGKGVKKLNEHSDRHTKYWILI